MIWRDEPVRPVKIVYIFNIFLYHIRCTKFSKLKPKYYYKLNKKTGLHKTSKDNAVIFFG